MAGLDDLPRGLGSLDLGSLPTLSSALSSSSAPARAPKPKPKRKKRWMGALLDNLEEFGRGIGPGVVALGKTAYNDLDRIAGDKLPGNHATSFHFDDVGKGIGKDYATRYGMLGHGDWHGFVNQVATRPLDFILDAATVLTLGVAAEVTVPAKLIVTTAKGGVEAGSIAGRLARAGGYVARTEENVARASKVYGALSKEVREGQRAGMVRAVSERGGGRLGQPLLRPAQRNPILRTRDDLVGKALDMPVLDNVALVGLHSRVARQTGKGARLTRDVRSRTIAAADAKSRDLSLPEKVVWGALHEHVAPEAYARRIEQTVASDALSAVDQQLATKRIELLRSPEVAKLYAKPSKRVLAAVAATKKFSDVDLAEWTKSLTGITDEQLLARRAMPERIVEGATATRKHPTDLQPTARAAKARPRLRDEEARRGRTRSTAQDDLERMRGERQTAADRLVRLAQQLLGQIRAQDASRGALRSEKGARAVERPMSQAEALVHEPGRVRHMPTPGREPSRAEVETMLAAMRRRLARGQWAPSKQQLEAWLAQVYRDSRYGGTPDAEALQAERHAVKRARSRRRSRKPGPVDDVGELGKAVDQHGAWSVQAGTLAQNAGPNQARLWKQLRAIRSSDERFIAQFPEGSLDRALAHEGFHPLDREANPVGNDAQQAMADTIEQWLDEQLDGGEVAGVARGVIDRGVRGGQDMDAQTAQAIIAEARRGEPDLPADPTNDEIADGIATNRSPDDAAADIPTQREFVDRASQAMLRVFEDGSQTLEDAGVEFGRIRGEAAHVLADRLGIRDVEQGVTPTGGEWARAIEGKLRGFGFDDGYREAAAAVRSSERQLDDLGTWAFRDDRFVPDPDQVDFGTMLEFVPEISPELRQKLVAGATSLSTAERATIRKAAGSLQKAARRVLDNSRAEAVLRQRIDRLAAPGRRERRLADTAAQLEPMKLKGNQSAQGERYHTSEFVDPATGELYADQPALQPGDVEGSYRPHMAPKEGRGAGSARAPGASRREPGAPRNVTTASTGRRFETGTDELGPSALLHSAQQVVRGGYASDLYDAALPWGIPFDDTAYAMGQGAKSWVVMDTRGVRGLEQHLATVGGQLREMSELLPEEQVNAMVEAMADKGGLLAKAGGENPEGLVMVPRVLYERLTNELQQSSKFAQIVFDRPLDLFRSLVLFLRPAYHVNNVVSDNFMLAVREQGPAFVPSYIRFTAHRNMRLGRELFREAVNDDKTGYALWDTVLDKHASPVRGASPGMVDPRGGGTLTQRLAGSDSRRKQRFAAMLRTPDTANELATALTGDVIREFRFMRLMQPHIKAARRAGDEAGHDAEIAMRLLDNDPVLAERVVEQTLFDLVDYRGMSAFERKVLRRIIPFYGWLRGISTWTAELGYNHPEQLLELGLVSKVGMQENAQWNDLTPEWMQGMVRLGGERDGVQRTLNTQGMNPISTLADLTAIGRAAFSEDPSRSLAANTTLGQMNPYAQALAAAMFNQGNELGTRYPMLMPGQVMNASGAGITQHQWPGFIGTAAGGFIASTPPATLYAQRRQQQINERLGAGRLVSATGVYQSPLTDYLLSYAGAPLRNVSLAAAQERRARDEAVLAGEGGRY